MPRAYYKPFTAYEEVVGFRNAKRNAYVFCGLFFGGIVFKCALLLNFSPVSSLSGAREELNALEEDPRFRAAMDQRARTAELLMDKEATKRAMRARLGAPPA